MRALGIQPLSILYVGVPICGTKTGFETVYHPYCTYNDPEEALFQINKHNV